MMINVFQDWLIIASTVWVTFSFSSTACARPWWSPCLTVNIISLRRYFLLSNQIICLHLFKASHARDGGWSSWTWVWCFASVGSTSFWRVWIQLSHTVLCFVDIWKSGSIQRKQDQARCCNSLQCNLADARGAVPKTKYLAVLARAARS